MRTKIVPSSQKRELLIHLLRKHAGPGADNALMRRIGERLNDELREVRVRKSLLMELRSDSALAQTTPVPPEPAAVREAPQLPLVATLRKEGVEALNARLAGVATYEELVAIAQFNSVAVPRDLPRSKEQLVIRLIEATEKRIAGIHAGAGQRLRRT